MNFSIRKQDFEKYYRVKLPFTVSKYGTKTLNAENAWKFDLINGNRDIWITEWYQVSWDLSNTVCHKPYIHSNSCFELQRIIV